MRLAFACAAALFFAQSASALYFYLAAGENRCFIEEIPKDTIVVGESQLAAWGTKSYDTESNSTTVIPCVLTVRC